MTTVFSRVGSYEIVREIGRGGMAAVFLARDPRHERQVALKLVPILDDPEHREILEAERSGAKLQAELSAACPLVPCIYEEGSTESYYYIAMEYVAGENLSDVIGRGTLSAEDAVRIAIELCRFLEAAHRFETQVDGRSYRSLVHGDLKPRNVRIAADGTIRVLDFGIAKALSLSRKVTRNDYGSMPYLSPERLDSIEVDSQSDLWALGVILYEMLAGALPFQARDTRRLEQQIRAGYARRPLTDRCPVAVRAVVSRLLAPSLEERYATATSVIEDLARVQAGAPTDAEREGWPARADEAPTRRTRPADAIEDVTRSTPTTDVPDEATRRTRPQPDPQPPVVPDRSRPPRSRRRLRAFVTTAALLLVMNEAQVGFSAGRLAAAAGTRDFDDLTSVWTDYHALSRRSVLRVGVLRLERRLQTRVRELAEQVIANYRGPVPSVRERQWSNARDNLAAALTLAPSDRWMRAALRYADGHLRRIHGEAAKRRGQTAIANQHFSEAVTAFREAAELRPSWPDPFLGLARTFVYGLEDIDRAADAMARAQRLGYAPGDRETAQLADGYRARGDALARTARQLAGMPQEAEYLRRAEAAYRQALGRYEQIPGFADVPTNLRSVQRALTRIQERLALIAPLRQEAPAIG